MPPGSHRDPQTHPQFVPGFGPHLQPQGGVSVGAWPPLLSPPSLLGLHPTGANGCGLIILSVLGNSIGLAVNKGF